MVGVLARCIRPEQIGQIIPRELLTGVQREANEQGEVLARTKPHLFAGDSEQGGTTQTTQHKGVSHI